MTSLPSSIEIVIVGAGPAGLACALVLASKGVPFLLLDALSEGQNESRAAVVHSYTLEQLEAVGVTDTLVSRGIHMGLFTPVADNGSTPFIYIDITGSLAPYTKYPYALMIAQVDVERILTARLQELGGVIHRQKHVTKVEDVDGALVVSTDSGESIRAKYVVGADGSKSVVRSSANIAFLDPHTGKPSVATDDDLQIVLADILLDEPLPPSIPKDRLWGNFDKNGFVILIPLKSSIIEPKPNTHLYRFAGTVPQGTAPHSPEPAYIQRIIDERGPGSSHADSPNLRPKVAFIASGSRYRVRSGLSVQFAKRMPISGGWVLLAGDAGHIHSPAGGQGMNLGLCDGIRLANALIAVTSGVEHADKAFKKYNDVRRPAAQSVITMVEGMTTLFAGHWLVENWVVKTLRNWTLRAVFAIPGVQTAAAWRLSGLVHRE
ncbi:FAD/NAD(P)-binding domain-containing protein [Exidia glandulosa HHB12029]|uniref:FAD/NAD(P)-binding domain-containing protein n=1 Tax=Exidia glandulosa HHB12029 TaxID=1314781 RepID=A0A165D2W4_EXIGL|nr:FAD/NAD(P)-binding domain-containing protein [Exidia glandulosa HHB12029]